MPYLALQEAAAEIHRRTTVDVTAEQLLRLGIAGELLIVSWFSSTMRNVTAQKNEDVLGLLVIPPMHLGDIEFGGEASIQGAFSLDGKSAYAPYIKRTREQLRIRRPDLESFIARIEKALLEKAAASAVVLEEEEPLPPRSPANIQPTPAVAESAPQRRARLLKWLDEEKLNGSLGALSRVVAREKLQKPNADRGNIGNDIRRGREERTASSAAGPFDGLGS